MGSGPCTQKRVGDVLCVVEVITLQERVLS